MITWLASLQKITRRTVCMSVLTHSLVFDRSKPSPRYRKRMFVTCSSLSNCVYLVVKWDRGSCRALRRRPSTDVVRVTCVRRPRLNKCHPRPHPATTDTFLESVWYSTMPISVPGCKFSSTAIYFPPLRRNRWDCSLLVNFDYKLTDTFIPILALETHLKYLVKHEHNTC